MRSKKDYDIVAPEKRFDIGRCGLRYEIGSDSIMDLIDRGLGPDPYQSARREVLGETFYFNDGKAADRAIGFIREIAGN